jgi:hypothetical protein
VNRLISSPEPAPVFADDEPVLTSQVLLPGAVSPRFGDCREWSFNGVLRRPANLGSGGWKLTFASFGGPWNLRARELAMIALNPRHPLVLARGIAAPRRPNDPRTVILTLSALRSLAAWASERRLSQDLTAWHEHDMHAYVAELRTRLVTDTVLSHVKTVRELHRCGPLLTGGGLPGDPWPGKSLRAAAGVTWTADRPIATPAIPPQVWFPLVKAAWTYIDQFAPDILRAERRYRHLQGDATGGRGEWETRLRGWLARPENLVPVHHGGEPDVRDIGSAHWSLLALQIGIQQDANLSPRSRLRALVIDAVQRGQCRPAGLVQHYAQVSRVDGRTGDWHRGLSPRCLQAEIRVLRVACYIFVSALSMMRDGEIHEITKGSVVQHYGAPAVVSAEIKGEEDFPLKHWWIIEPVAQALALAEQLTPHRQRLFIGVRSRTENDETFKAAEAIAAFVAHINSTTTHTGLDPIPQHPIAPHMFRRTMAMLTDQFPGSEIALGIQLKHAAARALANRSTRGYAASDASWAQHLDGAVEAARFRNLRDLFTAHKAGEVIGYGPGSQQLSRTFDTICDTVAAQGGDAAIEDALLKKARIAIRFGTLNNCLFDTANPAGALCLENAQIPPGHSGPLPDRCRPERCSNSMLGVEHIPLWDSEHRTLLTLLDTPGLPPPRRAALEQQHADVAAMLNKTLQ